MDKKRVETATKQSTAEKISVIFFLSVAIITFITISFAGLYSIILPKFFSQKNYSNSIQTTLKANPEKDHQFLTQLSK